MSFRQELVIIIPGVTMIKAVKPVASENEEKNLSLSQWKELCEQIRESIK